MVNFAAKIFHRPSSILNSLNSLNSQVFLFPIVAPGDGHFISVELNIPHQAICTVYCGAFRVRVKLTDGFDLKKTAVYGQRSWSTTRWQALRV